MNWPSSWTLFCKVNNIPISKIRKLRLGEIVSLGRSLTIIIVSECRTEPDLLVSVACASSPTHPTAETHHFWIRVQDKDWQTLKILVFKSSDPCLSIVLGRGSGEQEMEDGGWELTGYPLPNNRKQSWVTAVIWHALHAKIPAAKCNICSVGQWLPVQKFPV